MPTTLRGRIIALVALLAGVAALYYLFSTPPVPVDLAKITKGPLEVTVDEEGITRIREVYTISAPVSGLVARARLEVGDPVIAGKTVVATIAPKPPDFLDDRTATAAVANVKAAEAALKFALATVEKAKAELTFAHTDLARAKKLIARKTVSERTLDEAQMKVATLTAALENARADVEVKRRQLENAHAQLIQPGAGSEGGNITCCVDVRAPTGGRVLKLLVESTQVVAAGTPLLDIGDPTDLEVIVDLLSTDAVKVETGAHAYIERWGGAGTLAARVTRIEPAGFKDVSALGIEEQRVKVHLDLKQTKASSGKLGHDYRVFVRIVIWRKDDAVRVPVSALFRKWPDWAVFVVADGHARLRVIHIGHRNADHAEVLGGLKVGEQVVLHPSDRIKDKTAVVERKELD
jgi:HlyD family secretion protein